MLFLVLIAGNSCRRQILEDPYLFFARIPISIDWSESLINEDNIHNVSIYVYPQNGGEPLKFISDNINFNVLELPVGTYSIIVFNEMIGNMNGITFDKINLYSEFYAHTIFEDKKLLFELESNDKIVKNHEQIALWKLDHFEITQEMLEHTRTFEFEQNIASVKSIAEPIKPTPITYINDIYIEVENINNAQLFECVFYPAATKAVMSSKIRSNPLGHRNIYKFNMIDVKFLDASKTKAELHYKLYTLLPADEDLDDCELAISALLYDGTILSKVYNVSDKINSYLDDNRHKIHLHLKDESKVVLPPNASSEFKVNTWDDVIEVKL